MAGNFPTYRIPKPEMRDDEDLPLFYSPPANHGDLPRKEIPGTYGLRFVGPLLDRWDFFYNQGRDGFFQARVEKYKSTVFRANGPPGPFMAKNPNVVVLLDGVSFPILFDTAKVAKKDDFYGTYVPSLKFTGGYRVMALLDPSEPKHKAIKSFCFSLLAVKRDSFIPLLSKTLGELFTTLETQLQSSKEVEFNGLSDSKTFEYMFNILCGKNPSETALGASASKTVDIWLVPQIIPVVTLGLSNKLLQIIEDLVAHTFPIPPFLVKSKYAKIYKAFMEAASDVLDKAVTFGLTKDEACHNLIFFTCLNAYGGLKVLFPSLFKWLGRAGPTWHASIAKEVRSVVKQEGGVTFSALEKMPILKSTVYEVLRIDPPVPYQYGHAKEDLVIQSHDVSFKIKKGEMMFGYQPFATRDPKIFENANDFVPNRFMGKAEANLKYVYWSNGRETDTPTEDNKQCPGRDLVVLMARVMVAEFFLRYDTFTCTDKPFLAGSKVTFNSLTKATVEFTKTN